MKTWAGVFFVASGAGLLLSGCGGSPVPPASGLSGNWLIVGPMPTNTITTPPISGLRLAMTFDVTGNNVVASGYAEDTCSQDSSPSLAYLSSEILAQGTVAADGSFTLQTPAGVSTEPALSSGSISIQGKVPQTNGGEWPGSYTASITSLLSTCVGNSAGKFTAISFPPISGVYVGTGSSQTDLNGVTTTAPVTFLVSLQQGGIVNDPLTGATSPGNSGLSGNIQVQGSPCFNSGTISATSTSFVAGNFVAGNMVDAVFTMDDGSTLIMSGTLTDPTEEHMATFLSFLNGGKCDAAFYDLPEIDRQD